MTNISNVAYHKKFHFSRTYWYNTYNIFAHQHYLEHLGLAEYAARGLVSLQHSPILLQMLGAAFGGGIGSNVINNIPMAMLSVSIALIKIYHALNNSIAIWKSKKLFYIENIKILLTVPVVFHHVG
jgi:hypothetical protein